MKKYTKKQDEERYKITNVEKTGKKVLDDCLNFNIDLKQLSKLIKKGYINLKSSHNNSPTVEEFYNFAKINKLNIIFEGYIIANDREDRGIIIDAIHGDIPDNKLRVLISFAEHADELYVKLNKDGYFRVWWD